MTVKEAIKNLTTKAKKVDMREFSKYFGDISNVLFKQKEEHLLRKEILKLLGISGRYDGIMSKDLWMFVNDVNMIFYDKGKITVEALNDKVLNRLGSTEKKIIEKLANFTQKLTGKKLSITIGEQSISVSGPTGFRISVPDTKDPIKHMFPYNVKVIPAYEKIAAAGVPIQWIWAAHDWFHELAHCLGQGNEKKADTYAFRTAKKFFTKKYPKVKDVVMNVKGKTMIKELKTLYLKDKKLAIEVAQVLGYRIKAKPNTQEIKTKILMPLEDALRKIRISFKAFDKLAGDYPKNLDKFALDIVFGLNSFVSLLKKEYKI